MTYLIERLNATKVKPNPFLIQPTQYSYYKHYIDVSPNRSISVRK